MKPFLRKYQGRIIPFHSIWIRYSCCLPGHICIHAILKVTSDAQCQLQWFFSPNKWPEDVTIAIHFYVRVTEYLLIRVGYREPVPIWNRSQYNRYLPGPKCNADFGASFRCLSQLNTVARQIPWGTCKTAPSQCKRWPVSLTLIGVFIATFLWRWRAGSISQSKHKQN